VQLNLDLARIYQDEAKYPQVNDRLRTAAGLTNWSREAMADVVRYYVDTVHNTDAAIAFLEVRAKIDPTGSELIYSLAAMHATLSHRDEALKYLSQALATGGTNAIISAKIDPRFVSLRDDPDFQALVKGQTTNLPGTNQPATNKSSAKASPTTPPKLPARSNH